MSATQRLGIVTLAGLLLAAGLVALSSRPAGGCDALEVWNPNDAVSYPAPFPRDVDDFVAASDAVILATFREYYGSMEDAPYDASDVRARFPGATIPTPHWRYVVARVEAVLHDSDTGVQAGSEVLLGWFDVLIEFDAIEGDRYLLRLARNPDGVSFGDAAPIHLESGCARRWHSGGPGIRLEGAPPDAEGFVAAVAAATRLGTTSPE